MNDKILSILLKNTNQYVSKADISNELNISLQDIEIVINRLISQGFNIVSYIDDYSLINDDILNNKIISSKIDNKYSVEILDTVDSTNSYIKSNMNNMNYNHIVIANTQTGGRGRLQRKFYSFENSGIYISILVNPNCSIEKSLSLTCLTSVAVYSAIKELYDIDINIKWVNDLIINNLKVGGILCESVIESDSSALTNMIIGIGINVKNIEFPNELRNIATSIEKHTNKQVSRNDLIASIINCFNKYFYHDIEYMNIYKKQSSILNKEIVVYQNNDSFVAKAIDIDQDGSLIINKNNNILKLNSGEITIRKK